MPLLEDALEKGLVTDAAVAASQAQALDFWRMREDLSEVQKFEGGSIKHDVSVPVSSIPAFITEANAAVDCLVPGARPVPFGHFGDGNIHYNVTQPKGADKAAFLARWDEVADAVHGIVLRLGGSISAEHGIGRMKARALECVKSEAELVMMRRIKAAFDPRGILNPGKLLAHYTPAG
jgi:FAD/FMN-containing dehydrogenase